MIRAKHLFNLYRARSPRPLSYLTRDSECVGGERNGLSYPIVCLINAFVCERMCGKIRW
jgi:hypothetical protein